VELCLREEGLLPFIHNRDVAVPALLQRLRSEALASGDRAAIARVESLAQRSGFGAVSSTPEAAPLLPVLPLELAFGELHLSVFTVLSTFGTPQDLSTDEWRIECFYPADSATKAFFTSAVDSAADAH
jgi:hypothetical protein